LAAFFPLFALQACPWLPHCGNCKTRHNKHSKKHLAGSITEGITVNRWAHGYAYTPNTLFDPEWKEQDKPWVIGRKPFGKIAIANSDAGASAYSDVAIDQAWRSVGEVLKS
jgi:hypothetical protein